TSTPPTSRAKFCLREHTKRALSLGGFHGDASEPNAAKRCLVPTHDPPAQRVTSAGRPGAVADSVGTEKADTGGVEEPGNTNEDRGDGESSETVARRVKGNEATCDSGNGNEGGFRRMRTKITAAPATTDDEEMADSPDDNGANEPNEPSVEKRGEWAGPRKGLFVDFEDDWAMAAAGPGKKNKWILKTAAGLKGLFVDTEDDWSMAEGCEVAGLGKKTCGSRRRQLACGETRGVGERACFWIPKATAPPPPFSPRSRLANGANLPFAPTFVARVTQPERAENHVFSAHAEFPRKGCFFMFYAVSDPRRIPLAIIVLF
ncbi:MAG: hypothetical protein BJ554DRAFT_944, partial [Olpidium bornovanus]